MTIIATSKINIPNITCEKCQEKIMLYGCDYITVKCSHCGALYKITESKINGKDVEITFEFVDFQCLASTIYKPCKNMCPAPEMYCKEHSSDDAIQTANERIIRCEEDLISAKDHLSQLEESKRTWLIEALGGIEDK